MSTETPQDLAQSIDTALLKRSTFQTQDTNGRQVVVDIAFISHRIAQLEESEHGKKLSLEKEFRKRLGEALGYSEMAYLAEALALYRGASPARSTSNTREQESQGSTSNPKSGPAENPLIDTCLRFLNGKNGDLPCFLSFLSFLTIIGVFIGYNIIFMLYLYSIFATGSNSNLPCLPPLTQM